MKEIDSIGDRLIKLILVAADRPKGNVQTWSLRLLMSKKAKSAGNLRKKDRLKRSAPLIATPCPVSSTTIKTVNS